MARTGPFRDELNLARAGLADAFSLPALAWQVGGTMFAAALFAICHWLAQSSQAEAVRFVLDGVGFILAYVVLCATGCMVCRVIAGASEEKPETGTAPLHFLIDSLGAATVLPLMFAAAAVVVGGLLCGPAALWYYGGWQAALVVFLIPVFVLVLLVLCHLFALLFAIPAMVATEQPPLGYALRRIVRLFWERKGAIARLFCVGLVVAVLVILPLCLVASASSAACWWVYETASGEPFTPFAGFMLQVFTAMLLWAPILALPLVFLNALWLLAYDDLVEGLEAEEAELRDEEIDLEVEGEETPSAPPGGAPSG